MKISVIIPIYNVEKYINESLRSIFSQTLTEGVEFILVNDCSRDNSLSIAREVIGEFPHIKTKIIDCPNNIGVAAVRQRGLNAATGDYLIHFDPDDKCAPEMLEQLYQYAKDRDADIVVCDFYKDYLSGIRYFKQTVAENDGLKCVNLLLRNKMHGNVWSKLIRRKLIEDNNITFTDKLNFSEDWLFSLKVFCVTDKIAYLKKPFIYYRQNSSSITQVMSDESRGDMIKRIEDIENYLLEKGKLEAAAKAIEFNKMFTKYRLLMLAKTKQQRIQAITVFPEVHEHILNSKLKKSYWRYGLHSACEGRIWIFMVIKYTSRAIKKCFGRVKTVYK